jgi:uncharacterized membrane protein YhaH (DUF805 family)
MSLSSENKAYWIMVLMCVLIFVILDYISYNCFPDIMSISGVNFQVGWAIKVVAVPEI